MRTSLTRISNPLIDYRCLLGTTIIFLYIFSFYLIGPITSSILGAILLFPYLIKNNRFKRFLSYSIQTRFIFNLFLFLFVLLTLCVTYSILHLTGDYSYFKILFAQLIQLICGVIVVCWLNFYLQASTNDIIKWIIVAYLIQSIIEAIASFSPSLATSLLYFNRANDILAESRGARGLALSSGTTWNLGLTYGIVYILYLGNFITKKIRFRNVLELILLIIGTFFAGRTGFVGAGVGMIYLLVFSSHRITNVVKTILYAILIIYIICQIIWLYFPTYIDYALTELLPWALEPLLNLIDGNGLSSKSTDRLDEMWQVIPTLEQVLLGTGHFTNENGSYFMHVDVGYLRNLFYWGIFGYMFIILYQLYMLYPLYISKQFRYIALFITIYLFIGEYKAMTIGFNKMSVSIIFLLSFSQYLSSKCLKYQ